LVTDGTHGIGSRHGFVDDGLRLEGLFAGTDAPITAIGVANSQPSLSGQAKGTLRSESVHAHPPATKGDENDVRLVSSHSIDWRTKK
jgi:hypothetical protein